MYRKLLSANTLFAEIAIAYKLHLDVDPPYLDDIQLGTTRRTGTTKSLAGQFEAYLGGLCLYYDGSGNHHLVEWAEQLFGGLAKCLQEEAIKASDYRKAQSVRKGVFFPANVRGAL